MATIKLGLETYKVERALTTAAGERRICLTDLTNEFPPHLLWRKDATLTRREWGWQFSSWNIAHGYRTGHEDARVAELDRVWEEERPKDA